MRVLVVEDEVRQAAALKRGLEAEGFAVDVAGNGNDGLWLAVEQAYDAIVLDVMLPGLNGYKVCAQLREKQISTPVPTISCRSRSPTSSWSPACGRCCGAVPRHSRRCCGRATSSSTWPPGCASSTASTSN